MPTGYKKDGSFAGKVYQKGHHTNDGKHRSPATEFKKGLIPWNKGKHIWQNKPHPKGMQGKYHSEKTKKNMGQKGPKNPNWKGGKYKTEAGYIFILKPEHPFCMSNKYVFEHRLVVEKQIGRYLLSTEPCHHLGTKDDNRPHRLMAFSSESVHQRFHKDPLLVKPEEIVFDGSLL